MLKIKQIVVPVDFSEHAKPVVDHAVNFANHFDAKITFVHAVEPITPAYPPFETGSMIAAAPPDDQLRAAVSAALDNFAKLYSDKGRHGVVVLPGDPASIIGEQVGRLKADLVVMSTRGHSPFRRLVLGSVTTRVLNELTCPIFTGVHVESIPPHEPKPYRRIGVTVDLERDHRKVLRWAVDFAAAYEAKLYVIHGVPVAELVHTGAQIPAEFRNRLAEEAHDAVLNLLREMDIDADIYVAPSSEPERIAAEAAEAKTLDLLIAGRPHEEGILKRLSSHTYDIIRRAPCPVITI